MVVDQDEQPPKRPRGRPRQWPSEAARREHEAAKRRIRNKVNMTADELNEVRRLTALSDELLLRVDSLERDVDRFRERERELLRRLANPTRDRRPGPPAAASSSGTATESRLSRQRRRGAERAQSRSQGTRAPGIRGPFPPPEPRRDGTSLER
jgi:hypothetical protein